MFWKKQKRTNIKAVDDRDFPAFLEHIGVYDLVKSGEVRCKICGDILNIESIDAVFPFENEVAFICNRPKCMVIFNHQK